MRVRINAVVEAEQSMVSKDHYYLILHGTGVHVPKEWCTELADDGTCAHKRTKIWEPHLAGARKCLDCDFVYNPNRTPCWQDETPLDPALAEKRLQMAHEYMCVLLRGKIVPDTVAGTAFYFADAMLAEAAKRGK